jgi:hypothetical protein
VEGHGIKIARLYGFGKRNKLCCSLALKKNLSVMAGYSNSAALGPVPPPPSRSQQNAALQLLY